MTPIAIVHYVNRDTKYHQMVLVNNAMWRIVLRPHLTTALAVAPNVILKTDGHPMVPVDAHVIRPNRTSVSVV